MVPVNSVGPILLVVLEVFSLVVQSLQEKPLLVTPLLDRGKVEEARNMARVVPDLLGVKSYSGFITVDKACGTNYFFWFVPSEKDWDKAPVMLVADTYYALNNMFMDVGPFRYLKEKGLFKNPYHWAQNINLLFINLPAENGFSFSEKGCVAGNTTALKREAYSAILQFFKLFPNLKKNKFFIEGQIAAAKFVLPVACEIDLKNKEGSEKINLVGVILGNPILDLRCERRAQYLFELGIVDENERDKRLHFLKKFAKLITKREYKEAADLDDKNAALEREEPDFLYSYFNVLDDGTNQVDYTEYQYYIRKYQIRKQIHVGDVPFNAYQYYLSDDQYSVYTPSISEIQQLLQANKYILGFYFGQLDSNFPSGQLPCILTEAKWSEYPKFYKSNHTRWYAGNWLAGWVKTYGNVFEVVVRSSGAFVMSDQPRAALEFITAVVKDEPGNKLLQNLNYKVPEE